MPHSVTIICFFLSSSFVYMCFCLFVFVFVCLFAYEFVWDFECVCMSCDVLEDGPQRHYYLHVFFVLSVFFSICAFVLNNICVCVCLGF